jgi:hypothetical protein
LLNWPTVHLAHVAAAGLAENMPSLQSKHDVSPVAPWLWPAAQSTQLVALPAAANWPALQLTHAEAPDEELN